MRRCQLVSFPKFDQIGYLVFVALMRLIKGILFNLQLTLEKVDWVFVLGLWDAMNWHSMLFVLERAHYNVFVEFIDQIVDFSLQGLNAL